MIHIIIGTKAQLIKMSPVMIELNKHHIKYNLIFTGQHKETILNILDDFRLNKPDIVLYEGVEVTSVWGSIIWLFKLLLSICKNNKKLWKGDHKGIVLNHGDTLTTLFGCLIARIFGHTSAHIEAGLRSYNLKHPFPEEIIRIIASQLSNLHYAPDENAAGNIKRTKSTVINTNGNTLYDALYHSKKYISQQDVEIPEISFGVVSIHRFETINNKRNLSSVVSILKEVSKLYKLIFVMHLPTKRMLKKYDLLNEIESMDNVVIKPRYSYFPFIKLISKSSFVLTDGGSNQEECNYLGIPCLILRLATERMDGLGRNARLCGLSLLNVTKALTELDSLSFQSSNNNHSPSKKIVTSLILESKKDDKNNLNNS